MSFTRRSKERPSDLDCSILINNVGHRTGWMPYHESPVGKLHDTIVTGTVVQ